MTRAKAFLFVALLLFVNRSESQITNIPAPELRVAGNFPMVLSWPTNAWRFSLQSTTNSDLRTGWKWVYIPRISVGTNFCVTDTNTDSCRFFRLACYPQQMCRSQLAQIGLAFRIWEGDNYKYPFHLPANLGGTMELRAPGPDGFDANAFYHFRVLSNDLSSVALFVCPSDVQRNPAADFSTLKAENITYQLRTGDTVTSDNPDEIMMVCPIDGNIVHADGTVP